MKVTYLYHSGFSVELENLVLLFDYFKGELPAWSKEKIIYVFVSHKHKDHFNMKIFDLISQYDNVHFFLGSDVKLSEKYLERNHVNPRVREYITQVGKNSFMQSGGVKIETLRSTDAGVAFLVHAQGRDIYHGGDLNWWHWEGESHSYNEKMGQDYRKEIDQLDGRHFDLAFLPLDPRQEESYNLGMDYFLDHVQVDWVFPMHMWDSYDWIGKYIEEREDKKECSNIIRITKPGEEFSLWNI